MDDSERDYSMDHKPTRLGLFEVGECIGQGGMGRVFRARHSTTGVPVAIKVIRGGVDDGSKSDFHREVQAHAGLAHPGVVYLFDYGTVDKEAAAGRSDGELWADSPYVAMELASLGTVRDLMPFGDWQTVRHVLLEVLDALAFAHAREVIHRDLKPENFLVFMTDGEERRIKLADFGLAHVFGHVVTRDEESLNQVSGTPYYMTPEQFRGEWRSYGPWTDLYSLGCIAWNLICGRPPYVGKTFFAIAMKHCADEVPPLKPIFPIPEGVEAWIQKAMAQKPEDRFQRAADAARALPIDEVSTPLQSHGATRQRDLQTIDLGTTKKDSSRFSLAETLPLPPAMERQRSADKDDFGDHRPVKELDLMRPPLPQSWQTLQRQSLPSQLVGTGLGLFGLREVPFVDRDEARDRIWRALNDVVEQNRLRVVLVAGESGCGKSRLAGWMATRAHEVGVAEVLRADHTPGGQGPMEGFSGLVQRGFHAWKLSRGELYEELLTRLPPLDEEDSFREIDARALTELVHPTENDAVDVEGPRYQFASSRQKYTLMSRLLNRFARRRAPILWLDDLHYDSDAVGLIEYLLELTEDFPATLILGTLRTDVLAEHPELEGRVASLIGHEGCQRIDLDAIDASDHRELIERMLPLESGLVDTLGGRTEGNPLFAHQLLSNWIATDRLEVGEQGFRVVDGEELSVPDDIHQLWMERLERLLEGYGSDSQVAEEVIELAATLGRQVDQDEWLAVCAAAEYRIPAGLEDALIERGLARRSEDGWCFTHSLFVDSLDRRAKEAGRWQDHHRLCAKMLEEFYPHQPKYTARRRAEHWIKAQEFERALPPLVEASERWFELGATTQRKECLSRHRELIDRLNLDRLAPARLENDLMTSRVLYFEGKTEESLTSIENVLRRCQQSGDTIVMLRAHNLLATILTWTGEYERAEEEIQKALESAAAANDEYWQGKVAFRQGHLWFQCGDFQRSARCYRRSRKHFRTIGSTYDVLHADSFLGWVQVSRGQYQEGIETFQANLRQATRQGFRNIESHCLNGLGDIARFTGQLNDARRYYEQYHSIELELGDAGGALNALFNLAQVEVALGQFQIGQQLLEQAQSLASESQGNEFREGFDCLELLLGCGRANWSQVEHRLEKYAQGWPENRPVLRDYPWILEIAAGQAEEAGESECAAKLWRLTAQLWERLDDEEAAARARVASR